MAMHRAEVLAANKPRRVANFSLHVLGELREYSGVEIFSVEQLSIPDVGMARFHPGWRSRTTDGDALDRALIEDAVLSAFDARCNAIVIPRDISFISGYFLVRVCERLGLAVEVIGADELGCRVVPLDFRD